MKKILLICAAVLVVILIVGLTANIVGNIKDRLADDTTIKIDHALEVDEAGVFVINTAEDLLKFRDMATSHVGRLEGKLTSSIDMSGKAWEPFEKIVLGLDGQGYLIKNLTCSFANVEGSIGIIASELSNGGGENSYVKNIGFKNCHISVIGKDNAEVNVGLVTGKTNRAAVTGIVLDGCSVTVGRAGSTGEVRVGGIVGTSGWGYADNKLPLSAVIKDNCSITVQSSVAPYVGGLVGTHYGDILTVYDSMVNCKINASQAGAYVGRPLSDVTVTNSSTTTDLPPKATGSGNITEG